MKRLVCALMLAASWAASAYPGMQQQQVMPASSVELIRQLPEPYPIELVAFTDANGKSADFSQFRGKVVMVNMWATWCPPCVREIPALERLKAKLSPDDFAFLPISIDAGGKAEVDAFLKAQNMAEFGSFFDAPQNLRQVFPLDTIPATFILNREGQLVAFVRSYVDWDDPKAEALLQGLIAAPVSSAAVKTAK
ncbi:TlpA family protein disulfide reductase [Shewanella sp. JM162201]|uniref:TlpA family protein disulfide reductase n=1 Tax=Shewanella jiangmenensis TaxID=2837387 RepID=A0ABS5VA17_9GAMM|nr:TlpA disulfide reductase family protein [Shewanella jiangmenensis]MBT1446621.1 TlpA family protein disulfide reductase [Shewanella jiangmenensis]